MNIKEIEEALENAPLIGQGGTIQSHGKRWLRELLTAVKEKDEQIKILQTKMEQYRATGYYDLHVNLETALETLQSIATMQTNPTSTGITLGIVIAKARAAIETIEEESQT